MKNPSTKGAYDAPLTNASLNSVSTKSKNLVEMTPEEVTKSLHQQGYSNEKLKALFTATKIRLLQGGYSNH